jgi:hypothetical protein
MIEQRKTRKDNGRETSHRGYYKEVSEDEPKPED